jgi:predicted nucleotidyltransferase
MSRRAGYEESWDLTYLVEQLRELIGRDLELQPELAEELEDTLDSLVLRNQRLRGLQRMANTEREPDDLAVLRGALENMDRELMDRLPLLLERLRAAIQ